MPRQRPALASPAQGDGSFITPGGEARPASAPPRRGTMPTARSIRRSIERPLALDSFDGFADGLALSDDDGLKEDPLATAWAALGPKRRSVGTLVALSAAALAARETLAGSWGAVGEWPEHGCVLRCGKRTRPRRLAGAQVSIHADS
jgi:hypothetical protein